MEVEIRALADKSVFERLISRGAKRVSEKMQLDRYWANPSMFDKLGYTFLLRIRTDDRGRNTLSYKGAKLKTEGVWEEYEINFDNVQEAEKMLTDMGFENFINLKKKRVTFKLANFEAEVDEFENFGIVLEVETKCEQREAAAAKEAMKNFLMSLGFDRDKIIEKGSLALILEKIDSPYKKFFYH
jgi:predicted adenylyl cyclase CyaB